MHGRRLDIRFPGTHAGFARAFARLRGALDGEGLDPAPRYNVELVFEEIVANIVAHGAVDGREQDVRVTLEPSSDSIVLRFEDDGPPFDPRGRSDPVPAQSLGKARVGGFGLMLVRRAASALDYLRTAEGRNRVTVTLPRGGTPVRSCAAIV